MCKLSMQYLVCRVHIFQELGQGLVECRHEGGTVHRPQRSLFWWQLPKDKRNSFPHSYTSSNPSRSCGPHTALPVSAVQHVNAPQLRRVSQDAKSNRMANHVP
jgi:hypothetical protein